MYAVCRRWAPAHFLSPFPPSFSQPLPAHSTFACICLDFTQSHAAHIHACILFFSLTPFSISILISHPFIVLVHLGWTRFRRCRHACCYIEGRLSPQLLPAQYSQCYSCTFEGSRLLPIIRMKLPNPLYFYRTYSLTF